MKKYSALGIGKGKIIEPSTHQTGKSVRSIDIRRHALPPGKRMSKYGNTYYEYRKSRSDIKGTMV